MINKDAWIKCSERLPEPEIHISATDKFGSWFESRECIVGILDRDGSKNSESGAMSELRTKATTGMASQTTGKNFITRMSLFGSFAKSCRIRC